MSKVIIKIFFFIIFSFTLFSCASTEPRKPQFSGQLGDLNEYSFELDYSYEYYCEARLKFTNNTSIKKNIDVKIKAFDKNKVNIGDVSFYFSNLSAGETIFRKSSFLEIKYCKDIHSSNISVKPSANFLQG